MKQYFSYEGVFSPFSICKEIELQPHTFFIHPKNKSGSGWGAPFVDDEGNQLPYGTLDGNGQIKSLNYKKKKDKLVFSNWPRNALYGNVDWRGPKVSKNADSEYDRHILTWNGPRTRYFADEDFSYEELEHNQEVYYRGRCVCVAPYPVLGAGLRFIEEGDETKTYLYVICKEGLGDTLFVYPFIYHGYSREELTSQVVEVFSKPYHKTSNPYGYIFTNNIPPVTDGHGYKITYKTLAPNTPWLFNESCTRAVCMRMTEVSLDDWNGETYVENTPIMLLADLPAPNAGNMVYDETGPRGVYDTIHRYQFYKHEGDTFYATGSPINGLWCTWWCYHWEDKPDIPCDADNDASPVQDENENPQHFRYIVRWGLEHSVVANGDLMVFADFDGDLLINATLEMDSMFSYKQEFQWGVDCDPNYDTPAVRRFTCDFSGSTYDGIYDVQAMYNCPDPTGCQNDGKRACGGWGDEHNPYFLDGDIVGYTERYAYHILRFTNSDGDKEFHVSSAYSSTWAAHVLGYNPDPNNNRVEYSGYVSRFIHFIDLRHPFIVVYSSVELEQRFDYDNAPTLHDDPFTIPVKNVYYFREEIAVDHYDGEKILERKLVVEDDPEQHSMGYNHYGAPTETAPKPDVGGPNWELSKDVNYAHPSPYNDGTELRMWSYNTKDVLDMLEERSSDYRDLIEPKLHTVHNGSVRITPMLSWNRYFYKDFKDPFYDKEITLAPVSGSFARNGDLWIVSYEVPIAPDGTKSGTEYINYTGKGKDLSPVTGIIGDKFYPLGAY